MGCLYKHHFHISDSSHPGIQISPAESRSDADAYLELVGARSFNLRGTHSCQTGHAMVGVYTDPNNNWCRIKITDGPWVFTHPYVTASCHGMTFLGVSYDGIFTNSYTLKFD